MLSNKVVFTAEFDSEVWAHMSDTEQSEWIDKATDALNTEAHVSDVAVTRIPRCDSLTRIINGRSMQEHFEGCEIYQPGVIVDPLAGVVYKNETEARNA